MAWETRSGQRYYYRKQRIGGRVVSRYVGGDTLAGILAERDQAEHEERAERRRAARAEMTPTDVDRAADEALRQARILAEGVLLLAGLRCHRGQWRRPRPATPTGE